MSTVFDRLTSLLHAHDIKFDLLEHDPVYTSQEAASIRGTSLSSGAKALICKADQHFFFFVLPANRRLASKKVRKLVAARSLRFASLEEVVALTGIKPGSIPPFGSLFGLQTWCDKRLEDEAVINFNAGDHSLSISMSYNDFQNVEQPEVGVLTE